MKRNLILAIIFLVVIIIIGAVIYYGNLLGLKSTGFSIGQNGDSSNLTGNQAPPEITPEEQQKQIEKDYPLVIKGVINFLDSGKIIKTTIKADDGKVYTLWPSQRASIYESFGVKNGGRVEAQGRLNDQGNLEVGSIKPI